MSSETLSAQQLLKQLNWRYATKKFDPQRKISDETWKALEQALILTPSSFGLQPWKFFVIKDPELRRSLRSASWDQAQVTDASHLVVFAQRKNLSAADVEHYIQRIASVRNTPPAALDGYKQIMTSFVNQNGKGVDINEWAGRQVYIAVGNFLTCAALLGIDACPMEGIDPDQYDMILGLAKEGYQTRCAAAAGYRAGDDPYAAMAKVRYPAQEVITRL